MGRVDLRLGDCLVDMRSMPAKCFDLVLTDPPYGINFINGGGRNPNNGWRTFYDSEGNWDKKRPSKEYFDEILRVGKIAIIWGGNYFTDLLPPTQQWLIWDKGQREFSLADGEIAWSSQDKAMRIFTYSRAAMIKERVEHPTQKPVALMKWCIEKIAKAQSIYDPFSGSGTTAVACAELGIDFTGNEINPKYFDIASRRIADAQAQMVLPL